MTAQETLIKLINIGIVHTIGDEYFITQEADNLLAKNQLEENLTVPTVKVSISELYPETIRNASLDKKLIAVLDYCKVPAVIETDGGGKFLVRSNDGQTRTRMINILKNVEFKPSLVLQLVKDYYSFIPYPKAVKRFLGEGDFDSLYTYYAEGNRIQGTQKPGNEVWL